MDSKRRGRSNGLRERPKVGPSDVVPAGDGIRRDGDRHLSETGCSGAFVTWVLAIVALPSVVIGYSQSIGESWHRRVSVK
ncbi:MAG: hypothetical protein M3132_15100 [Actinomycetia bacterium]|nr:hypothetical protein [Actinomycetes bacterium]